LLCQTQAGLSLAVGLVRTSLCNGQLGIFGELISILLWRAHNSSNTLTFAQHVLHALKTNAATGSKNDTVNFGHLDVPRTWIKRTRSRDGEAESNACGQEEGFYKFLPANTADRLCQSWQSCSNHHEIQTVYYVVENPDMIRLCEK